MKNLFTIALTLIMGLSLDATARVLTVSNVAARPAQFTNLQAAVDSAGFGDTILITGGGNVYGNTSITIVKPLVLIGEGVNNTTVSRLTFGRFNSTLSSNGSRVFGLRFTSGVNFNPNFAGSQAGQTVLSNFIFERCFFDLTPANAGASPGEGLVIRNDVSNVTIRNSVFIAPTSTGALNVGIGVYSQNNIQILNCVFSGSPTVAEFTNGERLLNGSLVIRNSVFINSPNTVFALRGGSGTLRGVIFENNIFYASEPTGCTECTFNNNLTYLCNANALPPTAGNNVGSGNIVNADPLFTTFPQLGGAFSFAHNYALRTGSPAIGSGTNGTNIGLTGGSAPVNNIPQFPKIPAVTQVDIPVSSVPVGGTLQINLRAITRN